jgi:hypothetical protein
MSQNTQTIFMRDYVGPTAESVEPLINADLDRLRAEGLKIVRFFVKHEWQTLPGHYGLFAYLTAYIQRPRE